MDHSPSVSGSRPPSDFGPPVPICTAIVTGASSGIGRSIALALAEAGVRLVVCADVRVQPRIEGVEKLERTTHQEIEYRFGAGRAQFVRCDVTVERTGTATPSDEDEGPVCGMAELIDQTVQWAGRVDIMVNNAGVGIFDIPLHEMDVATWNKTISANVNGAFLGSKHAIAQFLTQTPDVSGFRGTLINVSSIGGVVGLMRCTAYCAAKAAIIGLTRATALEYAHQGIRCNAILPGYISTAMLQPIVDASPDFAAYLDAGIPAGRLGTPGDVAGAATWLADSTKSGYVTGIALPVDGGFTVR